MLQYTRNRMPRATPAVDQGAPGMQNIYIRKNAPECAGGGDLMKNTVFSAVKKNTEKDMRGQTGVFPQGETKAEITVGSAVYENGGLFIYSAEYGGPGDGEAEKLPSSAAAQLYAEGVKILGKQKLFPGVTYTLTGKWKNDRQYGPEFMYDTAAVKEPDPGDIRAAELFLSSGLFRGIGAATAANITAHFGAETMDIVRSHPERLAEVRGISGKKAAAAAASYAEAARYEKIMMLLRPYGITPKKIVSICERFGADAERTVRENPYALCGAVKGFGFRSADAAAHSAGISPRSQERIRAGIAECIGRSELKGNVYITEDELGRALSALLNGQAKTDARILAEKRLGRKLLLGDREFYGECLAETAVTEDDRQEAENLLAADGKIVKETVLTAKEDVLLYSSPEEAASGTGKPCSRIPAGMTVPAVSETAVKLPDGGRRTVFCFSSGTARAYAEKNSCGAETAVYGRRLWTAENTAAEGLRRLSGIKRTPVLTGLSEKIEKFGKENGITYAPEQKAAVSETLKNYVTVLTGGPGTGKTTALNLVIAMHDAYFPDEKIALAAPTGRAAKRLSEATGLPAVTLHRLLGYDGTHFAKDASDPLEYGFLVADEMSMADAELFGALISALRPGTRLLLAGDANQLPSVGPGAVLRDLTETPGIPCTVLRTVFRQKNTSLIAVNAAKTAAGDTFFEYGKGFAFVKCDGNDSETASEIARVYAEKLKKYGRDGVRVLTPLRQAKFAVGAENMNALLQKYGNPHPGPGPAVYAGNTEIRPGDLVMQMQNDSELGIFNGDTGTVTETGCGEDGYYAKVDFGNGPVTVTDTSGLSPAYASTVHKMQGAECGCIIMALLKSQIFFLDRNMFYTGMTRASEEFVGIGQPEAMAAAVKNVSRNRRHTRLALKVAGTV